MFQLPWTGRTAPHLVLEINQRCNIECKGCYKKLQGNDKPVDQIERELRIALRQRKIHTVSLGGGEPTLHPQLCRIVEMVRKKKLRVVLITNGTLLTDDLLADLRRSGLSIVMLHIDEGQRRPDLPDYRDLDQLRRQLASSIAAHGIDVGLAVTIYHDTLADLPQAVRMVLTSRHIHYLFATNYVDFSRLTRLAECLRRQGYSAEELAQPLRTDNREIADILDREFSLQPFAGLSGKRQQAPGGWINYFVPVITVGHEARHFVVRSSAIDRLSLQIGRLVTGRYLFYIRQNFIVTLVRLIVGSIVALRLLACLKFLSQLWRPDSRLLSKYLLFESGPVVDHRGNLSCCASFCPNATVRGDRLVHICLADHLAQDEARLSEFVKSIQ